MIELIINIKNDVSPEEVPEILEQIKQDIAQVIRDEGKLDTIASGGMITGRDEGTEERLIATYSVTIIEN